MICVSFKKKILLYYGLIQADKMGIIVTVELFLNNIGIDRKICYHERHVLLKNKILTKQLIESD